MNTRPSRTLLYHQPLDYNTHAYKLGIGPRPPAWHPKPGPEPGRALLPNMQGPGSARPVRARLGPAQGFEPEPVRHYSRNITALHARHWTKVAQNRSSVTPLARSRMTACLTSLRGFTTSNACRTEAIDQDMSFHSILYTHLELVSPE